MTRHPPRIAATRPWQRLALVAGVAALVVTGLAAPVAAQQLVDASEKGDVAFDVFAVMCFLFVGLLFAVDRVRKRDRH